jgi:hypothetical protein
LGDVIQLHGTGPWEIIYISIGRCHGVVMYCDTSEQLRQSCERNKDHCYIPEWLLGAVGNIPLANTTLRYAIHTGIVCKKCERVYFLATSPHQSELDDALTRLGLYRHMCANP